MAGAQRVAVRPRNRKQLILAAAGDAFAARGYHNVGMEDIAAAVGVSGPALYRHFPSKYAMFATCATSLSGTLLEEWATAPLGADLADPEVAMAHLHDVFATLTRVTARQRSAGGIYRWEGRYLEPGDREEVRLQFEEMIARVAADVRTVCPDDPSADIDLLSSGALSVVASITAHRTSLPITRLTRLVADAATRVVGTELPPASPGAAAPAPVASPGRVPRRTAVLDSAVHQFYAEGFAEVTIEAIAAEAGLTTSGFYRHFRSKAEVLLEACLVASQDLNTAVEAAGIRGAKPAIALDRLARAYVAHSFSHKEQMSVYYANVTTLPAADQARLRALQREHVALWVTLLRGARPDLGLPEARFLALAAISTVTDLGRRLHWRDDDSTRARVHAIISRVLSAP
ncbi:TetR/AcrR family transcriptional regulator [Nocardioides sp. SR21]|uniref:TetR/AcrR family transcriptional regulator n=1 Tax=Nocardioides sp. SR21 TaxID=2919501 RepID=UPI001FAA9E93|nr:TetR/AcrR family transcriptional regulator [Nocardioides sp. SR21]